MRLSPRKKTALKIVVVAALGLLALYCLYATIGQYLIWLEQPRFVHTGDGSLAWSTGFVIQFAIFGVLFAVLTAADIVLAVKFFRRKKSRPPTGKPAAASKSPRTFVSATDKTPARFTISAPALCFFRQSSGYFSGYERTPFIRFSM